MIFRQMYEKIGEDFKSDQNGLKTARGLTHGI